MSSDAEPTRRRRLRRRSPPPLAGANADLLLRGLLVLLVAGSVLALGAVHVPVMVAVGAVGCAGMAVVTWRARGAMSLPATVVLALAAYTVAQAIPLPTGFLTAIAPMNADVWARALRPFGEAAPAWAPLSVEPGATLLEALKWTTYAGVFLISGAVARASGFRWVALLVLGAAFAVALVTLAHGLIGATRVYGFHAPSQPVARWSVAPLINPNNLSGYLNVGTFAGLGLLLSRREPMGLRAVLALGLAVVVAVCALSGSRAGLVALVLGVVVLQLGVVARRWREVRAQRIGAWVALGLPGLLAIGGGIALAGMGASQSTLDELTDRSTKKLELVSWAKPLILDHPWWGVGRGAFEGAFVPYRGAGGPTSYTHAENFLADWAAGWGLPVTVGALATLMWALRPSRLQVTRSVVGLTCYVGAIVLLLQNLADLALEVPGVAIQLAAVFGGLSVTSERRESRTGAAPTQSWRSASRRYLAWGPTLLLAGLTAGVGFGKWRPAYAERSAVHADFRGVDLASPPARAAFTARLRTAVLRHPGDPYFPLVGALAAQRSGRNPLPWIARSLERDPRNGRAHLLLASVLRAGGHTSQALFELRLSVENDPLLIGPAGRALLAWTEDVGDIMRALPDGSVGAAMLVGMTSDERASRGKPLRLQLLELAVERDTGGTQSRQLAAAELIFLIGRGASEGRCSGPERSACVERVRALAHEIRRASETSPVPTEIEGELLLALGEEAEAARYLGPRCATLSRPASCHRLRVLSLARANSSELEGAAKDYLAAACTDTVSCAAAETFVGNIFSGRGAFGVALPHLEKAATLQPSEAAWRQVADVAKRAGSRQRQLRAERKADRMAGIPGAPGSPLVPTSPDDVLDSNP